MLYEERRPSAPLSDVIRCYWFLRDDGEAATGEGDPAFPDGSPELIFNLADPFIHLAQDGTEHVQPRVFLVGQITGPFAVRPSGRIDLSGVRLEAHGATWLNPNLSTLVDTYAEITSLGDIALSLTASPSVEERARELDAHLGELVRTGQQPDWRVAEAVREIRS